MTAMKTILAPDPNPVKPRYAPPNPTRRGRQQVRERIAGVGATPVGGSPADFEAMLKAEYEATGKLVSQIGLKVD